MASANAPVQGATGLTTDDQTNAEARRAAGEFVRGVSAAREWIQDNGKYPPESGRYHLYVAYNCPWCHRVLLGLAVLALEDAISVDVAFPNRSDDQDPRGPNLWRFAPDGVVAQNGRKVSFPACTKDTVLGKTYIKDVYEFSNIDDQKSVPILFDKETKTVVNNESAEILRMMGTVLRPLAKRPLDLYPTGLQAEIDQVNDWVYTAIANGSYKAGFSSSQDIYEQAYEKYFAALNSLEVRLKQHKFLVGDVVTEADLRLFPPLFRHDPVYHNRFKLNKAFLWEFPNVWAWMGRMMALAGMEHVSGDEYLAHCKQGYFGRTGNGTIPIGPPGYPDLYKRPHPSHGLLQPH